MSQQAASIPKIKKLDDVVVNRIAAGEVIQRPANALKELIENSLDAKSTNIQILVKDGGLKLLQIQDNGTGIRKEDMEIVCERFTTSKLQKFEDLNSIATFGFRGEALASISHIAQLTITTKTADEKCAYKAAYIDSKLKAPPKSCAGNQGTTITIENLFYNVATRRKALNNPTEEFNKIVDVVTKYAVHNSTVGFVLKKHGTVTPLVEFIMSYHSNQVRTPHNSTKMNNVRILYGNSVSRELLEVEHQDDNYKFKLHSLITNPNYTSKRMVLLLFINNRLVESSNIKKMLEELYSIYLPKKAHPWCYMSLHINPENIDVNVHPTKHEVKFLHEDTIIEKIIHTLDGKLSGHNSSRTFYLQSRLPQTNVTKEILEEVLPEYDKSGQEKLKKIHPRELIRTDSADQKLDKFNFTIHSAMKVARHNSDMDTSIELNDSIEYPSTEGDKLVSVSENEVSVEQSVASEGEKNQTKVVVAEINAQNSVNAKSELGVPVSSDVPSTSTTNLERSIPNDVIGETSETDYVQDFIENLRSEFAETSADDSAKEKCVDVIADEARRKVYRIFGSQEISQDAKTSEATTVSKQTIKERTVSLDRRAQVAEDTSDKTHVPSTSTQQTVSEFKSYSVNTFRREVKLTSVLRLRKEVEDNCHEGLRKILSELTFVGCIDEKSALVQSGVNLYLCNTQKLAEELFYEIMLYDFANYGVIKFSDRLPIHGLALLALETEEAGWTEQDGDKNELAKDVQDILLEKADMMKEYFSIVIDKKGNLKSLPILLDKYFPFEGGLPLYILRLATEVEWSTEQPCFRTLCRETAKYYSEMNPTHNTHDWKYITEHVLYPAIKASLLPPKHFAHDSTILQIASLPELYKVFERC